MIEREFLKDLRMERSQIQNCVSIYSQELERRRNRSPDGIVGLALDADVIYEYLHPRAELDFATAAIEALMQTDAVPTLMLPGTQEEIERLYHYELYTLSRPLYRPEANPAEALTTEGRRELFDNLKYSVAVLCDKLTNARTAVDRLSRFLSSRCFDQRNWSGLDAGWFVPLEEEVEEIFSELSKIRHNELAGAESMRRMRASMVDSQNIASILAAARNGLHIPFVTNTHALLHGIGRTIRSKPTSAGLVVGPFTAVTIVCLAKADVQDISRLRESAHALLKMMESPSPNGDNDFLIEFNEYMQVTYRLAEVGSLLDRTWSPPDVDLPDALDLRQLATFALQQVEILGKKIAEMSRRFGLRLENRKTESRAAEEVVKETGLSMELLKDIQSGDEKVIIHKLVILHEGAQMSEYNINQTGNNLTAIVDSFKTTQLIGSGLSNEVETQIKTLLDGIVNSKLPEDEKKDVIDAATKVVEDVKKEGRLAGTAKMLWGGIRETIKSVPAALAAWDALQKHWH